jgi:hypothetical protein
MFYKYILLFFSIIFCFEVFSFRPVTLVAAYSCKDSDRHKLSHLEVQIDEKTTTFLRNHPDFSISDFKNLSSLSIGGNQQYFLEGGYETDFLTHLGKDDLNIFQSWLNNIDELDSLVEISIPSFFDLKPVKKIEKLNLLYFRYFDSSIYQNFSNVTSLGICYSEPKDLSLDFDFTKFKNLRSLGLYLRGEIKVLDLPDLKHLKEFNGMVLNLENTDSVVIKGNLYGNYLTIEGERLKHLSFFNLLAVDTLKLFDLFADSLIEFDFSKSINFSEKLDCSIVSNSMTSFDLTKFFPDAKCSKLKLGGSKLNNIIFPLDPMSVSDLFIWSDSLKEFPLGIIALEYLEKMTLSTPSLNVLADDIYLLKNLEFLDIMMSDLKGIPSGIENLSSCKELYLHVNKISRKDLKRLGSLKNATLIEIYEPKSDFRDRWEERKFVGVVLKKRLPNTEIKIYK